MFDKNNNNIYIKKNINKIYKYWRIRIFYSIYIGYIFFYITRKNFTFLIPIMINDIKISTTDIGIISTLFYISYGISKLNSGIISDKTNPKYFMSIGLILTGIFNICFGLSSSTITLSIFCTLNGIFQAWGWPAITKQLTYWYSQKERGFIWGMSSTSHNIGGAIVPILILFISSKTGWRTCSFIIGFISIIAGLILINRLNNIPEKIGLPPIELYKKENIINKNKKIIIKKLILDQIIKNKTMWLLSISYFFIYIIKTAINDWIIIYLINQKGYELISAGNSIFFFEIGGFIGILLSGVITDNVFKGNRIKFIIISYIILIFCALIFWNIPIGYKKFDYMIITIIGFLIFGPQMLIGLLSTEIVNKNIVCTANGFVSFFAYFGAAITGYPFGLIINLSWNIYFILIILCTITSIFIMIKVLLYNNIK